MIKTGLEINAHATLANLAKFTSYDYLVSERKVGNLGTCVCQERILGGTQSPWFA
jgi:hypothetical protein